MDSWPQLQVHISLQRGSFTPPLEKCSCCSPSRFHCPFCSPDLFKPAKYQKTLSHMEHHLKKAVHFKGYAIHRCGLQCREQYHYHCLYCPATLIRRRNLTNHLPTCRKIYQQRGTHQERDNEGEDITIITDSDDQDEQEVSSSQSGISIISRSNGYESVEKIRKGTEPGPSKRDQIVQTDIEKPQDCDEYYFMNLVKTFKKLNPQKKSFVRMKIERLLFEAEFE